MKHIPMQLSFNVGRVLHKKTWREGLKKDERKRQEKLKKEKSK